ncbi:MAG: MoaD/ThiS family protein [Maricaulaceae bacterium]|nr:MoaD/ThiS family protein [Maricaulaceae bacterium]
MAITLRYFAEVRDRVGRASETADLPAGVRDGAALIEWLAAREPQAAEALNRPSLRLIVNDEISPLSAAIHDGDDIAVCPPFSGG